MTPPTRSSGYEAPLEIDPNTRSAELTVGEAMGALFAVLIQPTGKPAVQSV